MTIWIQNPRNDSKIKEVLDSMTEDNTLDPQTPIDSPEADKAIDNASGIEVITTYYDKPVQTEIIINGEVIPEQTMPTNTTEETSISEPFFRLPEEFYDDDLHKSSKKVIEEIRTNTNGDVKLTTSNLEKAMGTQPPDLVIMPPETNPEQILEVWPGTKAKVEPFFHLPEEFHNDDPQKSSREVMEEIHKDKDGDISYSDSIQKRRVYRPPINSDNPKGAGRSSELTDELLVKIRECIFEGLNYLQLCEKLDIPYDTFHGWKRRNYNKFADSLYTYEQEHKVRIAEANILEMMTMDIENDGMNMKGQMYKFRDPKLVKIKADMSQFVVETLGKNKGYTKRTEQTGKDGEPLKIELSEDIARKNGLKTD